MATEFQKQVWETCSKIPKGKIATYSVIARVINRPRAARAVGNALNKNPHAPKVPCHRVVNSTGELGGYSKGLKNKIKLLEREGMQIENKKIRNFYKKLFYFARM